MTGTPMLKAAGLWARTSAKGNAYFVGRLGGVKIVILANRDRGAESDPSHFLFFAEAPDRPREPAQGSPAAGTAARPPRRHPPARARRPRPNGVAADPRPFDDEIPF